MKPLGDFQRYLLEEFVEDWRHGEMSRREMVRRAIYLTGGTASAATALLSVGCAPMPTPTAIPPTATPVPPTATPAAAAAPSGPRSPLSVAEGDPAIEAQKVEFDGEVGKVFGYLARPKTGGPFPGLIVIHENRGLVPHIQDVTRRAGKAGYVAPAVDLLSRNGGTDRVTDPAQVSGMLGQAWPEDLVADLNAGIKFLKTQPSVRQDRIGALGFCFGGGYTLRLATANKEVRAAAPFYGPNPPLESIPNTEAAILAIYGETDSRINTGIPQVEAALKSANRTFELKIYPGVNHAFHNDTGAAWNEAAALDAWAKINDWFKKRLA